MVPFAQMHSVLQCSKGRRDDLVFAQLAKIRAFSQTQRTTGEGKELREISATLGLFVRNGAMVFGKYNVIEQPATI